MTSTSLIQLIGAQFQQAFASCGFDVAHARVTVSDRPDLAQFQCNGALAIAKQQKLKPRDVAQQIIDALPNKELFSDLSIAGPGFINLTLTDEALVAFQKKELPAYYSEPQKTEQKKIVLDYGGANIAKPLHVGHLRSAMIGDSIKRILRFLGHEVFGDIHMGDWGTQMGIVICELKREHPELPYFDEAFKGAYPSESPVTLKQLEELYPRGAQRVKEDAQAKADALQATVELQNGRPGYRALWKHIVDVSVAGLQKDYADLGVEFDWWYGESHYHDRIAPMVERLEKEGYATQSEGATVILLGEEMPPLLLKKSDGAFLYSTTDLAAVEERIQDDHADVILYVVDQRQGLHFDQVFAAAKKVGLFSNQELRHLGFGTMNGADGKPFKTRAGGVMKLRDLIDMITEKARIRMEENDMAKEFSTEEKEVIAKQVGVASLKFADLMNHRASNYMFDLEKFSQFEGKTGPYLLYTTVRIGSILRKAELQTQINDLGNPLTDVERQLMLKLALFPDVISGMLEQYLPHLLCEHLYELAQTFNHFYTQCRIVTEKDEAKKKHWLALCAATQKQLEVGLQLLGISVPKGM